MLKLDQIRSLHVELTTMCNARCPMCMRNYHGFEYNSGYPETQLTLEQFKHIVNPKLLSQLDRIMFNGNLGDFGLASDAQEIVEYILQNSNAKIKIETNGSMRTPAWWARLSNPRIRILWALDGMADTHSLYRQDTDWHRVIANARAHIQAGGTSVWKFIPFEHNQHQFEECQALSKELGFVDFVCYDQGRNQGPVFSRKGEFSHWLGPAQENKPDLNGMLESHVTWFDHRQAPEWINETDKINCKHLGAKELYVAADGTIYPCCWLGFYPTSMSHPGNSQFSSMVKNNNALTHDLETCMAWFAEVEASWSKPNMASGKLYTCLNNCTVSYPGL
jgi:sulfatase maturation enzyme AslB (radical SAM superfamily)